MIPTLLAVLTTVSVLFATPTPPKPIVLAQREYSLANRYANSYVNGVFSDNILLTLAYMGKNVKKADDVSWDVVKADAEYRLVFEPGQTFAFHDIVMKEYEQTLAKTTNAHFTFSEGFRTDGHLVGDGVCHLASFMNVVARDAGLETKAPTSHSFANIPDVPEALGVSIYYDPSNPAGTSLQNLYITNTKNKAIVFIFDHKKDMLSIRIEELL